MKSQARLAMGVGIGYLLGRTRKMRLALMIAAAGATGAVGSPRQLVQRGLKQLGSSPELSKLTEVTRGQLIGAAKTAAVTAASSRIDALNERLEGASGAKSDRGTDEDEPSGGTKTKRRRKNDERGKAAESEEDTEEQDTEEQDTEASDAESDDEPPARPRKRKTSAATTRRRATADSSDDQPRRSSGRGTRTPVRRARR